MIFLLSPLYDKTRKTLNLLSLIYEILENPFFQKFKEFRHLFLDFIQLKMPFKHTKTHFL